MVLGGHWSLSTQLNFGFTFLGIYYEPQCRRVHLNHAVLVVGYGFEGEESDGNSYWLVKNSNFRKHLYLKFKRELLSSVFG